MVRIERLWIEDCGLSRTRHGTLAAVRSRAGGHDIQIDTAFVRCKARGMFVGQVQDKAVWLGVDCPDGVLGNDSLFVLDFQRDIPMIEQAKALIEDLR
jgi:hypothetical protein